MNFIHFHSNPTPLPMAPRPLPHPFAPISRPPMPLPTERHILPGSRHPLRALCVCEITRESREGVFQQMGCVAVFPVEVAEAWVLEVAV